MPEEKRIVVLGGSFNPPTIAHFRLMQAAMQAIEATQGLFIPVDRAYLKRKMRRANAPLCLSEETRMEMLQAMCREDDRLSVSDIEIRQPGLYTEQTLRLLQKETPDARFYFLAGADKLQLVSKWAEKSDFLTHFRVVMVRREDLDPQAFIREDACLSRYQDAFEFIAPPQGTEDVSSTRIRAALLDGNHEAARASLHPAVWPLFAALRPDDYPPEISSFRGEYDFLNNVYPVALSIDGQQYPSAEAAYQAARCEKASDALRFTKCRPERVKSIAANIPDKPGWDAQRIDAMSRVLRAKFIQNPDLIRRLVATGHAELVMGTNGRDKFWGRDLYTDEGENNLGRLLMTLREELKDRKV